MKHLLFPRDSHTRTSLAVLFLRLALGLAFVTHGWAKLQGFSTMSESFPDPTGFLGSPIALSLAIFAELVCAIGLILGLLHRLALIPMIFTMLMAFFVVHNGSFAEGGELAFVYLVGFVTLWITGSGTYSADYLLFKK